MSEEGHSSRATPAFGVALSVGVGIAGVIAAVVVTRGAGRSTPEQTALGLAHVQEVQGHKDDAMSLLMGCAMRDRTACACGEKGAELAVEMHRAEEAYGIVHKQSQCATGRHQGGIAELLVASGRLDEGRRMADMALQSAPDEPHACFAKAWALSASGPSPEALDLAEKAVRGGRGVPALLLLATLRSDAKDAAGAAAAVQQASQIDPDNPRVAFDVGVIAEGRHDYNRARTAYLHALALDPKMADARYNLARLAHSVGANDEARHDLEELVAIAPSDPRIEGLRKELAK